MQVTRKPNVQQHKDTAADMEIATEDFAKLWQNTGAYTVTLLDC